MFSLLLYILVVLPYMFYTTHHKISNHIKIPKSTKNSSRPFEPPFLIKYKAAAFFTSKILLQPP